MLIIFSYAALYIAINTLISQYDFNYKAKRILVIIDVSDNSLKYNKITQN